MKKLIIAASLIMMSGCGADTPAPEANAPPPPSTSPATTSARAPAPASPQADPATPTTTLTIDWAAARADLAANSEGVVSIQSANEPPAPVPVLLPTGIVISQSADSGPVYRNTPDGYFAFYPGAAYNLVVNGTNQAIESDLTAASNPDKAVTFTAMAGGAFVWLTRYGADYTVEFECNEVDSEGDTCITKEEAIAVVDKLIVARSR